MSNYRKAIAATVTSLGVLVGALILLIAPDQTEIAAAIVSVFAAAAPIAVWFFPNDPTIPNRESIALED